MTTINNCTFALCTYDNGEDLWDGFFECLKKNWPEFDMPIVMNTESKTYNFDGYNIYCPCLDKEHKMTWSKRLKNTLKFVDTENILLFLEDYWIKERVDNSLFLSVYDWFNRNENIANVSFCETFTENIDDKSNALFELRPKKCKYKINCQAALWNRKKLISYLRDYESAWDFEINGSIRASRYDDLFYSIKKESVKVFSYEWGGVVHRGKWFGEGINDYISKYGLCINPNVRGYANWEKEAKSKESFFEKIKKPNLLGRIAAIIRKKISKILSLI